MQYKIVWLEQKPTKEGKPKMEATLTGEDGVTLKATIWGDFPNYSEIVNGGTIEGDIVPAKDPKYLPTLYAPKSTKTTPNRGRFAPSSPIVEASKVTAKSVEKALDRKEDSFKISAVQRDSVICAIAEFEVESRLHVGGVKLEPLIEKWAEYHWTHYDRKDSDFLPPDLSSDHE